MDIARLHDSIEWSKQRLESPVKNRREAIEQFVGTHYSDNGAKKRVPTNFLELATTIYVRLLAARSPRCLVSTDAPELMPFAADLEEVVNQIPKEIGLDSTLRQAVLEAMFSMAVVKIGIYDTSDNVKVGDEPFVSLVQLDDYFVDMSAKSWREIQYEGNDYELDVEEARSIYGAEAFADDDLSSTSGGVPRASSVTVNESGEPLRGRVRVRDVYLTKENRMVTYVVQTLKVLRDVPWDGPEGTPYLRLAFGDVPGNLLPLPPVAVWRDLHELGNAIFRKLGRQADAKKTVAAFQGGNDEDIQRLKEAADGEGIRYNGSRPEAITVGGVDTGNLAFYIQLKDIFNVFAGNIDALGGLSPQADTATQEKLITEASSARIKDMGDRTVEFAKEIFRRLAWYAWTDPVRERKVRKVASSLGLAVTKQWTPETRDGDFLDYNFDIDVFSMRDNSPETQLQKFFTVLERFFIPFADQLQMQGAYLDMKRISEYIAEKSNLPELSSFIVFQDSPPQAKGVEESPTPEYVPRKSPVSHRVYERVNRPGATRHGRDAALTQILLGGRPQEAEVDSLSADRSMT